MDELRDDEKYPKRLGLLGDTHKSIHHYCVMKKLTSMKEFIGADAYDDILNNSQLGIILKFAGTSFVWASKYVQYLLGNMLECPMMNEVWVLADGRPIRFSLYEFEYITRLNCGLPDPNDRDLVVGDLWDDMKLVHGDGPNWKELEGVLESCKEWSLAKRKMVGLLVILYVAIFGLHTNSRIPVYYAKLVMDPVKFERHPWGRVAFLTLVNSIKKPSSSNLVLHGFVHVLLVWAFEYLPYFGVMCGSQRSHNIPLMAWGSRTSHKIDMEDVFESEKTSLRRDNREPKITTTHFLRKRYEEIYPVWPNTPIDPKVDRLIKDILAGTLDETFWAVPEPEPLAEPEASRKRKGKDSPQHMASSGSKRELRSSKKPKSTPKEEKKKSAEKAKTRKAEDSPKTKPKDSPKAQDSPKTKAKAADIPGNMTLAEFQRSAREKLEKQWMKEFVANQQAKEQSLVLETLKSMKEHFDVMRFDQINMSERLGRLEEKDVDQAVTDERLRRLEASMAEQNAINQRLLKMLEAKTSEELAAQEERKKSAAINESRGSDTRDEDEDGSAGEKSKGKKSEDEPSPKPTSPAPEASKTEEILEEPIITLPSSPPTSSPIKKESVDNLSPALKLPENSPIPWGFDQQQTSDPESPATIVVRQPEITSQQRTPIEATPNDSECQILDGPSTGSQGEEWIYMEDMVPKEYRPRTLAANQKSPFEGSSVVRRIIEDDLGPHSYDPFGPVLKSKIKVLRNVVRREL